MITKFDLTFIVDEPDGTCPGNDYFGPELVVEILKEAGYKIQRVEPYGSQRRQPFTFLVTKIDTQP